MTTGPPVLTPRLWRSRRAAAIAGIIFGVLLMAALAMSRIALAEGGFEALQADAQSRSLIRLSLNLVPFAGIAFLWFIGVLRDQLGAVEDRLFSSVFLGSGVLFLAMLFLGAVNATSLMGLLVGPNPDVAALCFRAQYDPGTDLGLRHEDGGCFHSFGEHRRYSDRFPAALGLLPRLPRRSDPDGGRGSVPVEPAGLSRLGPPRQSRAAHDSPRQPRHRHHNVITSHADG